jgi:hypothetical protein
MPILIIVPAISEYYPDIAGNDNINIFKIVSLYFHWHFLPIRQSDIVGWGGRLLRYRAFAVDNHSCIPCASHPILLGRVGGPRLVNNPGYSIMGLMTFAPISRKAVSNREYISSSLYMPMIEPPDPANLADAPQARAVMTISMLLSFIFMI